MADTTSWYNRELRPGASMLAEGESGSPADPALLIHEMKTAARKAAEGPTPPGPEPEPAAVEAGMYEGAGGYQYEVSPQGAITIIKAPKGRGVGTVLTRGMAYNAILEELGATAAGVPDLAEGGLTMDTRRTQSAEFDDIPGMDYPEPGVVSGEGASGRELAYLESLTPEEQLGYLREQEELRGKSIVDRPTTLAGRPKVAMGSEAKEALARTKARTAKFPS